MQALAFDTRLRVEQRPLPVPGPGEALVRVRLAGICNTDLEITRGYVPGFAGILGHEFVGTVERAADPAWLGRRVTAEINCGCGSCPTCRAGDPRHCAGRSVVGIRHRDGAFAEYLAVPERNLVAVDASISDRCAVFIEPLAAALAILEQVAIDPATRLLLIGDGKLAQLIARMLAATGCALTVVGKHRQKLALLAETGATTLLLGDHLPGGYDVVVEASGNPAALALGLRACRPRGTLVLKSTYAGRCEVDTTAIVVNEITVVGSRCGRFETAIAFLKQHRPDLERLVDARFPLVDGVAAFERAATGGCLKVLLEMG